MIARLAASLSSSGPPRTWPLTFPRTPRIIQRSAPEGLMVNESPALGSKTGLVGCVTRWIGEVIRPNQNESPRTADAEYGAGLEISITNFDPAIQPNKPVPVTLPNLPTHWCVDIHVSHRLVRLHSTLRRRRRARRERATKESATNETPTTPAAIWPFSARTPVGDRVALQMAIATATTIAPSFEAIIKGLPSLHQRSLRVRASG